MLHWVGKDIWQAYYMRVPRDREVDPNGLKPMREISQRAPDPERRLEQGRSSKIPCAFHLITIDSSLSLTMLLLTFSDTSS